MLTRVVEANRIRYTLAMDKEVPALERLWGIVRTRVVDELTGRSVRDVRIETQAQGFVTRVTRDGLAGLLARPAEVFPRLAERDYPVNFTIYADGYIPHRVDVTFATDPEFPVRTILANAIALETAANGLAAGLSVVVDPGGPNQEVSVIASVDASNVQIGFTDPLVNSHTAGESLRVTQLVGPGNATAGTPATVPVQSTAGFSDGDLLTVDPGGPNEESVVVTAGGVATNTITVDSLTHDHNAGEEVILERNVEFVGTALGASTLFLRSTQNISAGNTLLVGRRGIEREQLTVQNVAGQEVTLEPTTPLTRRHDHGSPVIVDHLVAFDPGAIVLGRNDPPVGLHRPPITIEGRVIERTNGVATPVAGADVELTGIWRAMPGAVPPAAELPRVLSLRPALYFGRPASDGLLRSRTVTEIVGEDKVVLNWNEIGEDHLRVSDSVNLAVDDFLLIATDSDRQELVTIASISSDGTTDLPATIELTHGLAYSHRPGTRVRRVTLGAVGTDRALTQQSISGDTCLFLNNVAGLDVANIVGEVVGAQPGTILPNEYHWLGFFATTSDASGNFRLPPLSRVAQIELQAVGGANAITFIPDYVSPINTVNIEL